MGRSSCRHGENEVDVSQAGALAERVIARVRDELKGSRPPERVPLDEASKYGAPSARWVTAKAREGLIKIHGPRGGRFVRADELAALLAASTIRRKPAAPGGDVRADARGAVAELAARRAGR
jgi:hypothetical protein